MPNTTQSEPQGLTLPTLTCTHCDHAWIPRKASRARCPRCQKPWGRLVPKVEKRKKR